MGERFKSIACAFLIACTVVSGCTQFQEYRPEPISAPMQAEALDARTLDNPRLQALIAAARSAANASEWDLGSLTLAALYYHPDIELARSRFQANSAAVMTAAQTPNPTVSADLMVSPFGISPVINFLIETFNRRQYRTAQAQALVESAREDLATAAWQVRGRVRTALINMWASQGRSNFLQQRFAFQDQLVGFLERRLQEGEASSLDVTRERINRNQITLAIRDADRQLADARAQLATSVGIPVQALEGKMFSFAAFDSDQLSDSSIPDLRRTALTSRSDVQALLAQYRGAESGVQLEIAKQYPNVNLGPGYTAEPGTARYEFTFAAAADLPVFNQNQGPIAEAEARRRGVAAQLTALQAQTIGAIDTALTSYRAAGVSLAAADALLAQSRQRAEQLMRSLEAGETDRPTLVSAEIELSAIKLSHFEAYVLQRQAIGALEDALQRQLFEPDSKFVADPNSLLTPESMP